MMERKSRQARTGAVGVYVRSAALVVPGSAAAADTAKAPTFTKDIAPIFQEKCEACHRPDSIAPMSLMTFAEARPWARSIKARVTDRQMPPWQIDRTVGIQKFKNDRSLTDDQVERSEEHTSELQSRLHLVCRLLLEKKKKHDKQITHHQKEYR